MNGNYVPWEKTVNIQSNTEISIPYQTGQTYSMNQSWSMDNSDGSWFTQNSILQSQESFYYENSDSSNITHWLESEPIDIAGSNRAVILISHRYETEWDFDPIKVSIIDLDNIILGSKTYTGDSWDSFSTDLVTAFSEDTFSNVKIRIKELSILTNFVLKRNL